MMLLNRRKWLRTAAALVVCFSIACTIYPHTNSADAAAMLPYDDIRNNYAQDAILNMTKTNIMNGTGSRRFEPLKAVSRAEFIAMIDRLLAIKPVASPIPAFADVPKTAWYYEWIQPAVQLGIAKGTFAARFEPGRSLTREEAAAILARALKQPLDASPDNLGKLFKDHEQISPWAHSSVAQLVHIDLLAGNAGKFLPRDLITRQEAAVLMNRAWTHAGWTEQLKGAQPAAIQLGWQYGQTTEQFKRQVADSEINTLSPRWYFLSKTGSIEDQTDTSLIDWARQQRKAIWAMVGNHSDQDATHAMLADAKQRQAFASQLADRVRKNQLDGLNIDFENMMPEDRNNYTAFIMALHEEMKSIPAALSVNVSPDFGTDWTAVFDYAELARQADYIVLMGYDEHWGGAPVPGSVSSLPWLQLGMEALLKQAPGHKVILALPLYTRNWTIFGSGAIQSADISLQQQNLLVSTNNVQVQWDDQLGQYQGQYYDASAMLNQIWLEDGGSLAQKVSLGEQHQIAGYGYWYMGGESADVWTSVRNTIRFSSYRFSS